MLRASSGCWSTPKSSSATKRKGLSRPSRRPKTFKRRKNQNSSARSAHPKKGIEGDDRFTAIFGLSAAPAWRLHTLLRERSWLPDRGFLPFR